MSVRVMAAVFDRYPNASEMLLALALADHAHDDGTHIFPSVASLAKKTRRSERAVQYQLSAMIKSGWLVLDKRSTGRRGQTNAYVISEEWLAGGDPIPLSTGANFAPVESVDNSSGTGAISGTDGCNIEHPRVKPVAPKPSLIIINQTPLTPQGGRHPPDEAGPKAGSEPDAGPVDQEDTAGGFPDFWAAWPNCDSKHGRAGCLKVWRRRRLHRVASVIVADVLAKRESRKWKGGFIEAPGKYLKESRWLDSDDPAVPMSALDWDDSRPAVEAMGVRLGLGRWDEAAFHRTHEQSAMFHVYAAKVRAAFDKEVNGAN